MKWLSETPRYAKRGERGKENCALALDVGGTFLKSAVITSKGLLLEKTFQKTPIDSQGSAETIVGTFTGVLKVALQVAEEFGFRVVGIGIGMPGPFDYGEGISLMEHKYASIYGLNVKREFIQRLDLHEDFSIRFENDAWTFLRGEAWRGAAQGYNRIVGLTLGTGLGSAFMVDDEIMIEGPGVPPHAWVGALPYDDGIVEDKISRRGIIARYRELAGNSPSENKDVEEIAFKGLKYGDKNSLQVFDELGSTLAQVMKPLLSDFEAECLVLGGQISKSFSLFEAPLKKQLSSVPSLKNITSARLIDLSALYGAAKLVFQKNVKRWGVIGVDE
jgi:glucokinase